MCNVPVSIKESHIHLHLEIEPGAFYYRQEQWDGIQREENPPLFPYEAYVRPFSNTPFTMIESRVSVTLVALDVSLNSSAMLLHQIREYERYC
jgi:hypothetical protein